MQYWPMNPEYVVFSVVSGPRSIRWNPLIIHQVLFVFEYSNELKSVNVRTSNTAVSKCNGNGKCIYIYVSCFILIFSIYYCYISIYPRVTSFDALKQLISICAHLISCSCRKYIILNKLSYFKSKHTFSEVREHLFCLKYRCQRVYV